MTQQQTATTLLQYKVNQASVQSAVAANQNVAASYASLAAAAATFSPAVLALNPQLAQQAVAAQNLAGAQSQLAAAYTQTAAAANAAATAQGAAASAGRGRTLGQNVTKFGRGLFNLPDIGGVSTPVARGLILGGAALDKLGASAASLAIAAPLAAAAVVGVAVALEQFNVVIAASKSHLNAALQAQDNYYDALKKLTTQQAKDLVDEIGRTQPILQQQINETRVNRDRAFALEQTLPGGDATARVLNAAGLTASKQLDEQLKQLELAADAAAQTFVRLKQGIGGAVFVVNDIREAHEQLVKDQLDGAKQLLEVDSLTKAKRDERIAQDERNIDVLTRLVGAGGLTDEALIDIANQINVLNGDIKLLTNTSSTYADQLLREEEIKERITTQADNYLEALDTEAKIRDEISETIRKMDAVVAERDEKLLELAEDRAERRAELEADAAERLQQIALDSSERVAKIMRDAGREQGEAVARRDVTAFLLSRQRAADQLDDQQAADKKAIDALAKQLTRQEAQVDKSYDRQYQQLIKASNKQLATLGQGLQQQQVDLQNAQYSLQQIALYGSGGLVVIQNNMWASLNTIAGNWANTVANTVAGALSGIGGGTGGIPGGIGGGIGGLFNSSSFKRAVDNRVYTTLGQVWTR